MDHIFLMIPYGMVSGILKTKDRQLIIVESSVPSYRRNILPASNGALLVLNMLGSLVMFSLLWGRSVFI